MLPRVFARPLELRKGQSLGAAQIIDRLNDLGYAQRARAEKAGEFAVGAGAIAVIPRGGNRHGETVRIRFDQPRVRQAGGQPPAPGRVSAIEAGGGRDRKRHARPAAPHRAS